VAVGGWCSTWGRVAECCNYAARMRVPVLIVSFSSPARRGCLDFSNRRAERATGTRDKRAIVVDLQHPRGELINRRRYSSPAAMGIVRHGVCLVLALAISSSLAQAVKLGAMNATRGSAAAGAGEDGPYQLPPGVQVHASFSTAAAPTSSC
jgi:hypothetical protein